MRSCAAWPVEGTTGYEFLNEVLALCVNADAEEALTTFYEEFTGDTRRFEDVASLSKLEVAVNIFEPELRRLHEEVRIENLPLALASFRVYRTYIEPHAGVVDEEDRAEIGRANVSEELRRILFLQERGNEDFVVRFQQTTGPVLAKGLEDTAFYRYFRLAALNEVGGDPARFGLSIAAFHQANAARAARFPLNMLTTYTHDTKRSPDVRSRIAALSWFPEEWTERVRAWHAELGGLDDAREELLVYQTLIGALPIERAAARRVSGEGAARRKGQQQLARAEHGARAGGSAVRRARSGAARPRPVSRSRSGRRSQARTRAAPPQADLAGRCPTSTAATSWRISRSSTPTTGGRSTGPPGAKRSLRCRPARLPTRAPRSST